MSRSRLSSDWDRTALLLAKMHNVAAAKRSDLLHPRDFHPYAPARAAKPIPTDISILKIFAPEAK